MKLMLVMLCCLALSTQAFAQSQGPSVSQSPVIAPSSATSSSDDSMAPALPAATPGPTPDTRATAHDSAANDPSVEQLVLPHAVPQRSYAAGGIGKLLIGGLFIEWAQEIFNRYPGMLRKHADWFEVLRIHEDRYQPKLENGPALVNAAYEFEGISDKKFGYCWGFSTLLRNFLTLAFYDPSLPRLEKLKDYDKLISKIADGKAIVIPGFANLREFTLVPEIELMMKVRAMKLWRDRAIRTSSIGLYLKTANSMEYADEMSLVDTLEAKLARGELPKIVFSSKVAATGVVKLSKYIHVVLVNGIERLENGGARIKIWDVNFYAESLAASPKYLEINPDGTIVYEPWFEPGTPYEADSRFISRISMAPENDREIAKHVIQLRKFCNKDENAARCLAPAKP
jgi:hypothetical protein